MEYKLPDINTLARYVKYLDNIRSRGSVIKKIYYIVLYYFAVPWLRIIKLFFKKSADKSVDKCDILVVGTCPRDIEGSSHIWEALTEKGYKVETWYMKKKTDFFKYALKVKIVLKLPGILYLQACLAKYLVSNYQPRLLITFYSYDVLPSFLRYEMKDIGKTVFMPHAVIPTTHIYTSTDYDYYFVFGESSFNNLQAQKIRIGNTKIVMSGSPMINDDFILPEVETENRTILYFSNWLVGIEPDYTKDYEIVIEWAKIHPEFKLLVKIHPLEKGDFVKRSIKGIPNIEILSSSISIIDAVKQAALSIVAFSVASLESAILKRPVVVANSRIYNENSEDARISDKFLFLEKYFQPRATSSEELNERIMQTFSNYPFYVSNCDNFVKSHIKYGGQSKDNIINLIISVLDNKDIDYEEISECLVSLR